jgi:sulfotransferase
MDNGIHFISGLPRSGSTLLAALLRQNPRFHAGMTGPVSSIFLAMLAELSGRNEFHVFIEDEQRKDILAGLFTAYYRRVHPSKVVFDTSRVWCAKMPALVRLFPKAKVICCVRHLGWIVDSIERLVRRNAFEPSKIFGFEPGGSVYARADALTGPGGMVGFPYNALKEAFYGEHAERLLLVTYDSLTRRPGKALAAIYDFIGEKPYEHDFDNVEYDADDFDARLGTPGLHRVAKKVEYIERPSVLPPEIFQRYEGSMFWADPANNKRGVRIV